MENWKFREIKKFNSKLLTIGFRSFTKDFVFVCLFFHFPHWNHLLTLLWKTQTFKLLWLFHFLLGIKSYLSFRFSLFVSFLKSFITLLTLFFSCFLNFPVRNPNSYYTFISSSFVPVSSILRPCCIVLLTDLYSL